MSSFSDFNLHPKTRAAIEKLGYSTPTKIQEKSLPIVQSGQDVAGLAQTGTGKTAAFLMPVMTRLLLTRKVEGYEEIQEDVKPYEDWGPRNCVLVLVPTRELAEQVSANLRELDPEKDFTHVTVYGGVGYEKQTERLKEGADFVIATPGRLIDLYKEKVFDPSQVKCVIFDEADRMFDMGFKDDMRYLLERIPKTRQFLVFSATLNFDVLTVAYEFGSDPVEIEIDRSLPRTEQVKDEILHVGGNEKPKFLISVLKSQEYEQAIVFTNFVRNTPRIEKFLKTNGFKALGISSALSQSQRTAVMQKFKAGEINILVATDVAARGLDIENVDLVVNFELSDDAENYVHRIGRTGRAGREGVAVSLVSEKDVAALARLEDFLKQKLDIGWMEDDQIIEDFKPFPYDFDPKSKLSRVKGQRPETPYGKGKKTNRNNKDRKFDKDKKHTKNRDGNKPYKKDDKDFKSKPKNQQNGVKEKSITHKKQSTKRKTSSRYDGFKTVKKGGSSKSLWQKVKGLFS